MRRRLSARAGSFSLGRGELPVAIAALVWIAVAVVALVTPPDALVPSLVVVGLLVLGAGVFAVMLVRTPAVLDAEPEGGAAVDLR